MREPARILLKSEDLTLEVELLDTIKQFYVAVQKEK